MAALSTTIAIATYGRREIVRDTIHEILNHRTKPQEIIVVEQDSPYDVSDVVDLCCKHNIKCTYTFSRYRSTPCARNYAIYLCRTDIIIFIDDDVELLTDLVAAHTEIHEQEPDAIAAGGLLTCYPKSVWFVNANSFFPETKYLRTVKGGNMSFKVARIRRLRGFNCLIYMQAEENDFIRRLLWVNPHAIVYCPDAMVLHLSYTSGGTRRLEGASGPDRRTNAASSYQWWRVYLQDHVVSYATNYGVCICLGWLVVHFRMLIQVALKAPSRWQGLRNAISDVATGLRLSLIARRCQDHIAFSHVLATNTMEITCPQDVLSHTAIAPCGPFATP